MSTLENIEGELYGSSFDDEIADTLAYTPSGGAATTHHAFVDFRDQARSIDGGRVIEQDILVEISKAAVPVEPTSACRITLPKRPGKTFKPVNVGTDVSGNCWIFELAAVA